jgi:hypothetical protein
MKQVGLRGYGLRKRNEDATTEIRHTSKGVLKGFWGFLHDNTCTLGQFIGTKNIAYSNGKSKNIVLYSLKRMCMNFQINL